MTSSKRKQRKALTPKVRIDAGHSKRHRSLEIFEEPEMKRSARAAERVVSVIAKCVSCGEKKEIYAGEVVPGDHPMCPICYSPMVAQEARSRGMGKK